MSIIRQMNKNTFNICQEYSGFNKQTLSTGLYFSPFIWGFSMLDLGKETLSQTTPKLWSGGIDEIKFRLFENKTNRI